MKYGIIYLWYDRKHKRFYLGCHWGTEDDGYVCSSSWMKKAHKRRPEDFKRRILKRVYTNRKELLEEEHRWLQQIHDQELGSRYYNVTNRKFNHWSVDEMEHVRKTISIKTKEAMMRPEIREKYLEGLKNRDNRSSDPIVREKRRKSMMGKNKGKDNSKAVRISAELRRGVSLSQEHIQKIKNTTKFNELNKKIISCIHCGTKGNVGNIARYHMNSCKRKLL